MSTNWQRWKNIMKAYPFEEKRLLKWTPPFIVQPKYDGVRCRVVRLENGEVMLLSSEENVIFSVPHLNTILRNAPLPYELDGELYRHGMSFDEILSITSRTMNLHSKHEEIHFHLFDVVTDDPQYIRLQTIHQLKSFHPKVEVAPFWLAESLKDVMAIYDNLLEQRYEGIIVRNFEAPYERKRSTLMMKFKPKQSDIYKIVGYKEEVSKDGVPKRTLGALELESGDGETFFVGTGFTSEERRHLWSMRGILKGSYAKVQYQHRTSGKQVPRFPVYTQLIA